MIWLDAHLSPRLAQWIQGELGHKAAAVRDLGLRDAEDVEIFERAHEADAIVLTKDRDFVALVSRRGSPPKIIGLRCGNTSENRLKEILASHLEEGLEFLSSGEDFVEIQ